MKQSPVEAIYVVLAATALMLPVAKKKRQEPFLHRGAAKGSGRGLTKRCT
jgi:hypothetical protein